MMYHTEETDWLNFKFFMIGLLFSTIPFFFMGVFVHSCYNKEIKKSVWLQAVERGYAEEVETSDGKVFVWKNSEYLDNRSKK